MRVPWKSGQIVRRILVAKIVQQQERIELLGFAETEGALQLHACSLNGGFGFKNLFHSTQGHWDLLEQRGFAHSYYLRFTRVIFVATTIWASMSRLLIMRRLFALKIGNITPDSPAIVHLAC